MKKKPAKIIFQDIFIGSQISLLKQEKEGQLKATDVPKYLGCLTPGMFSRNARGKEFT